MTTETRGTGTGKGLDDLKDVVYTMQVSWPGKAIKDFVIIKQISVVVKRAGEYDESTLNLQKKYFPETGEYTDRFIWSKGGKFLLQETDIPPTLRVLMERLAAAFEFGGSDENSLRFPC